MTERLRNESGYSLVEVMAAIVILTIAIIPMVTMFDTGLRSATTSGNYDRARAFANEKLEEAKSLSYDQVRGSFPVAGAAMPPSGEYNSPSPIDNTIQSEVPEGFTYVVRKRFVWATPNAAGTEMDFVGPKTSDTPPTGSTSLGGMIEVRVTVNWGDGNSYSATGLVAK